MKQIVEQILDPFTDATGIKVKWTSAKSGNDDGKIDIVLEKEHVFFFAEVKRAIRLHHVPELNFRNNNLLLVTTDLLPAVRKELQQSGINYIDATGNAFIRHKNLFILLEGKKRKEFVKDLKVKPFSKGGLKVICQLFLDGGLINATIREIAEAAGVSLDTVHKTINGLKQLNYLVALKEGRWKWNNKKELLEKWMAEYDVRLKPTLYIGNFRFLKEDDFLRWEKVNLKKGTQWGSEPAGELLTGFLKPEKLTLYTGETKAELIKNYRLLPDPKGNIIAYEKFWKMDEIKDNVVPPILAYTDLINTGNRRNIETAQKIYEQFLQDKF